MEALGSPTIAAAMAPLFSTMSGFTPKKADPRTQIGKLTDINQPTQPDSLGRSQPSIVYFEM